MSRILSRTLAAIASATLVSALAACSSTPAPTQNAEGLVPIKVGVLTTATNAPIFMGVEQGFFEDQGLDVELEVLTSGATIVPSLMSKSLEFAYTGAPSVLIARSNGLPIKIVANGGSSTDTPILVKADSGIRTIADLDGARIGVSSLGSLPEISLVSALDAAGVQRDEVEVLEVPLPDATQALDQGSVDAVWSTAPFSTIAINSGNYRSIGSAISGEMMGLGNAVFIATEDYLAANGETAKKFAEGIRISNEYAADHIDEVLETVPTFTGIEPGVLSEEDVTSEFGEFQLDRLKPVQEFMLANGFLDTAVHVEDTLWKPAE